MNKLSVPIMVVLSILCTQVLYANQENDSTLKTDIKKLINGKIAEQQSARVALRKNGRLAIPLLGDVVENEADLSAKARATSVLLDVLKSSDTHNEENLTILERLTKNSNPRVSSVGALAIMQFKGNAHARRILKDAISAQSKEGTKAQFLGAYVFNIEGDKSQIPFIKGFLDDKSEYVQVSAAGYLGSLGDSSGVALCKRILELHPATEQTKVLQMQAAIAAGRIGSPILIPVLKVIANSKDYGVAQWPAHLAIKDIELRSIADESEKLKYLKNTLGEEEGARWAAQQLMALGTEDAKSILRWAAKQKGFAGAQEARHVLAAMAAAQSGQ